MSDSEPTGRTRLVDKGGALVLQVEERKINTAYVGGQIDSKWVSFWRNAEVADITGSALMPPAGCRWETDQ